MQKANVSIIYCVFVVTWTFISSLSVINTIKDNEDFQYEELSLYPSKLTTIEYQIRFNFTTARSTCRSCYPRFDIYTTRDDSNLVKNCSINNFGQLRNENLHTPLKPGTYRFTTCKTDKANTHMLNCQGKTTIQDYIPRHYGFSFGFKCEQLMKGSLKGVTYNISIYDQTNDTNCLPIPRYKETDYAEHCGRLYSHVSLPNLIGNPSWDDVKKMLGGMKLHMLEALSFLLSRNALGRCYKYVNQVLCYTVTPQCDPHKNQTIYLCREMCYEMIEACIDDWTSFLDVISISKEELMNDWKKVRKQHHSTWFTCGYLPSKDGTIPCFYKPVTCGAPPNVTNGVAMNSTQNFTAGSIIEYSCQDETLHIEGNNTITCMHSGQWSDPPKCLPKVAIHPLFIVISILTIPSIGYILMSAILNRCTQKPKEVSSNTDILTRHKQFDAFVCYNFDSDHEFAEGTILNELQENHDPQFRLCINCQDFIPGRQILENIQEAIENSNSAIIVLSQGFVDSIWCKEEFKFCYIENMKDPAFRLFVIMMQPVETLKDLSGYMKSFFDEKTYLAKKDPKLFEKIAAYLTWVKLPKDEKKLTGAYDRLKLVPEERRIMLRL